MIQVVLLPSCMWVLVHNLFLVNTNAITARLGLIPFLPIDAATKITTIVFTIDVTADASFSITTTIDDTLMWDAANNNSMNITLCDGTFFNKSVICIKCNALSAFDAFFGDGGDDCILEDNDSSNSGNDCRLSGHTSGDSDQMLELDLIAALFFVTVVSISSFMLSFQSLLCLSFLLGFGPTDI
ncbi:hypothetical protein FRACYDRAFT_241950 [Fragilariopsis cylindrus CCMP1102]|uniref:Uncharacterized protein n=1 Tax=Fragilariopsis cylindrus CCMP1102 TaxID=635003 RepID=A0A1E7F656_9STRA|nr:hypothetical protein FRACYDRAFT_241950 [Fragilariopsis cylindrus CCMP1102]|eukprot:OEU13609.1 hypothetical protein FRACYDRAFT_241950 [Fragilariopsis cylindrus CCMP1102]